MRYEFHNLDGIRHRRTQVFDVPSAGSDYWAAVTNVPCPVATCDGVIRWHEAGYVPGYRRCDTCQRHFLARGTADAPALLRVGTRRG